MTRTLIAESERGVARLHGAYRRIWNRCRDLPLAPETLPARLPF